MSASGSRTPFSCTVRGSPIRSGTVTMVEALARISPPSASAPIRAATSTPRPAKSAAVRRAASSRSPRASNACASMIRVRAASHGAPVASSTARRSSAVASAVSPPAQRNCSPGRVPLSSSQPSVASRSASRHAPAPAQHARLVDAAVARGGHDVLPRAPALCRLRPLGASTEFAELDAHGQGLAEDVRRRPRLHAAA
jgi:hypothetical protein